MAFIVFPGQGASITPLRILHKARFSASTLAAFLDKSHAALREEIFRLPASSRASIPASGSVLDLAERLHQQNSTLLELTSSLLCASQIGTAILRWERDSDNFAGAEDIFLGHGIGQLSAVAVACSDTPVQLIKTGVEAVRLAFRLGELVARLSSSGASRTGRWTLNVPRDWESIEREIARVQGDLGIAAPSRAFISLVAPSSCEVSGEPTILAKLVENAQVLKDASTQGPRSSGLWHAGHIYNNDHVSEIVQSRAASLDSLPRANKVMIDPAVGRLASFEEKRHPLAQALEDILLKVVRLDRSMDAVAERAKSANIEKLRISTVGDDISTSNAISSLGTLTAKALEVEDLQAWLTEVATDTEPAPSDIAIVGMSCRFPGADSNEAFWDLLERGQDMCREIPSDRFDIKTHYDPSGKKNNTTHTPYGCFIENPGAFDARFFNMSPREAVQTDPMHRLALLTAYEALEMSGFVPNRTPSSAVDRVGTFYGQTSDDWREVNAAQEIGTYLIPGGVRAFAPGRISYYFGFRGPSYSVDTACASSLGAIQLACSSLAARECDTVVAGGLNILTAPDIFAGLSRGQFLSRTGSCKTWDATADGYCRADGIGTVVLKRLDDALADRDNVLGVVMASATNHSADAVSITHPHAGNQASLFRGVLNAAGVDPTDVSYVEMHGTGTQAGDACEVRSVTDVFAPTPEARRQPLCIGAVKSNIGHGEAAAGVAALIKVLLMLQKRQIPRHVGVKTRLNPELPLEKARIPWEQTPWLAEGDKPRLAFVNNFSAAGGNTSLILREPPRQPRLPGDDKRPSFPFLVSAKSLSSLKRNVEDLLAFLEHSPATDPGSLSYTLTARRMHHTYRIGLVASTIADLKSLLSTEASANKSPAAVPSKPARICFVFTGQGAFFPGLGKQLCAYFSDFARDVRHFDSVGTKLGFPTCLPAITDPDAQAEALPPAVTQLATLYVQMALTRLWRSLNVDASAVIGHSLGEYAALHAAGVLSATDAIYLVGHRARLLEEKCRAGEYAMLAVKASPDQVRSTPCDVPYEIACLNSPTETVLTGRADSIDDLSHSFAGKGYRCTSLKIPYAFHSAQLQPILHDFEKLAQGVVYNKPSCAVASPLYADLNEAFDGEYLARHVRETVNFEGALRHSRDRGVIDSGSLFVEIGPHPICSSMVKATIGSEVLTAPSLRKQGDPWETLCRSLCSLHCAGVPVDWSYFHRDFDASHELLQLPSYGFDLKNYWIDYVNDWCLHKTEPRTTNAALAPALAGKTSGFTTSSIHQLVLDDFQGTHAKLVALSNMNEPTLREAVQGHLVNGKGLCPSSLYADMALTLADLVLKRSGGGGGTGVNVGDMEVMKPLILSKGGSEERLLRISLSADLEQGVGTVRYASVDSQGKELEHHATCSVTFEDLASWAPSWESIQYLIEGRIEMLKEKVRRNEADKVSRALAYKLFAALVTYDTRYQGMEEVFFDSASFEGTSRVRFQTQERDGSFFFNPFWIDSLAHLSGFILNGSGATDSANFVYISHGWQSMRFKYQLDRHREYTSYVKMQPRPNNVMAGDVYVFDGDTIVGVVGGLKFQRIPRRILDSVFPNSSSAQAPAAHGGRGSAPTPASAPAQTTVKPPRKPGPSKVRKPANEALEIISREADLPISELQDDCEFQNLGVDSLLSLQISARLSEQLDLEIRSSAFLDYRTVGQFKQWISEIAGQSAGAPGSNTSPQLSDGLTSDSSDTESEAATNVTEPNEQPEKGDDILQLVREEISEQTGVPLDEVTGSNDLASLGMDSLMTICVLSSLREKVNVPLPSTLFQDYPSIDALKEFFSGGEKQASQQNRADPAPESIPTKDGVTARRAESFLLQGSPRTASKHIFLFPDGSGSATSYTALPPIEPSSSTSSIVVFGLNCPFMTTPSELDPSIGITGLASLYLAEVRRRKPHGPYVLGGWSAGGIVAFEVTRQLLAAGESVEALVLFDAPSPLGLDPLPPTLHRFLAQVGLLGAEGAQNKVPEWLLPHFEATIRLLDAYEPLPLPPGVPAPKALAIWARYGVCKNPDDPRPEETDGQPFPRTMTWLLENRTDFGTNGWEKLLDAKAFATETVEANHFTMMRSGPHLDKMSAMLREFLSP